MFILVLRNIQRRPFHTALTVFIVAVAVAALFASIWLGQGLERGLELGAKRLGADIVVLPEQIEAKPEQMLFTGFPLNIYMDKSLYKDILAIPGVKQATPQFFTRTAGAMCCGLVSAGRVVGFDPDTDFIVGPWMKVVLDRPLTKNEIIVGSEVQARAGDDVLVRGELFEVVERLEPTGTGIDGSAFILMATARRLAAESPDLKHLWREKSPDKLISAVLVQVESPDKVSSIVQDISKLPGVNAVPALQVVQETRQRMRTVTVLLYALTGVLWLVSLVSLLGRFVGLVVERKTEIGILRSLGAMRWSVFRLILLEAGFLALVSGLIGLVLGWFASRYVVGWVTAGTNFPFLSLPFADMSVLFLWCLLAAVVTVLLSALFPAYYSASLDPARAIAQGELE
ncbi:MAG: FtsX-like permease family protein [Actinobacteria bacterium]|nr:FtsX-like permease family protein [Actinomycetota bacterium]